MFRNCQFLCFNLTSPPLQDLKELSFPCEPYNYILDTIGHLDYFSLNNYCRHKIRMAMSTRNILSPGNLVTS